jgi:hypothetical protein
MGISHLVLLQNLPSLRAVLWQSNLFPTFLPAVATTHPTLHPLRTHPAIASLFFTRKFFAKKKQFQEFMSMNIFNNEKIPVVKTGKRIELFVPFIPENKKFTPPISASSILRHLLDNQGSLRS